MSKWKQTPQRARASSATLALPSWLWAPCALYAVSAACILIGIAQIIVPIYEEQGMKVMEKFYCLIALNFYEIALLAVALLLVLMRRVLDDAIAVTLILCIFLGGSSIALDTVAPGHADASLLFGAAGLMMAMAKLFALNRFVVGRMNLFILAGVGAWMVVNFLLPGWLGMELADSLASKPTAQTLVSVRPALLDHWLLAWLITIGGGVLVLVGVATVPTGNAGGDDIGQPFLRTAAMRSIVMIIVMAATFVHLYAVTFAFSLNVQLHQMLPATGIAVLVLLEILRAYGFRFNVLDTAVAMVPALLAVTVGMSQRDVIAGPSLAWLTDPAVFLGGFALLLFLSALRRQQVAMHYVWLTCAGLTVLIAGVDPQLSFDGKLASMNWSAVGFVVSAGLVVSALLHARVAPAVAATLVFAMSLANTTVMQSFMHAHGFRVGMMVTLVTGLGLLAVYAAVPKRLPRELGVSGAFMVAIAVTACFGPTESLAGGLLEWLDWDRSWARSPVNVMLVPSLVCAAMLSAVSWWTRDRLVMSAAWTPLTLEVFQAPTGWSFVMLSFIVLGFAATASWRKGEVQASDDEVAGVDEAIGSADGCALLAVSPGASVS